MERIKGHLSIGSARDRAGQAAPAACPAPEFRQGRHLPPVAGYLLCIVYHVFCKEKVLIFSKNGALPGKKGVSQKKIGKCMYFLSC